MKLNWRQIEAALETIADRYGFEPERDADGDLVISALKGISLTELARDLEEELKP